MSILNLGILAHVDAGKTSLTERLLYVGGVIDHLGSVDSGSTQTDSLALEQQRKITIRSAVATFAIGEVTVNLIDTPGHPDFIAEVARVLNVLDGAVLVVSAVEGVQAQARVLMRALQRLRIPTLIFVNKIDRSGARCEQVLADISRKLAPGAIAMGSVRGQGSRTASYIQHDFNEAEFAAHLIDVLAAQDNTLLTAYIKDEKATTHLGLRECLAAQTKQAIVHPVFFGSAITGAGIDELTAGITELLPTADAEIDGQVSGSVFKVERSPSGEKFAYVRMFSGTIRVRDRLHVQSESGRARQGKLTAISVFHGGSTVRSTWLSAGQIGKLQGLSDIQIGDAIGSRKTTAGQRHHFSPPTLETVVVPRRSADKAALHHALAQLAEQDPLINLRQDDLQQEIYLSLYGEVQKEVIQATLVADHGIDVAYRQTTTICVERPIGIGTAVETIYQAPNPFLATVGLRIQPAAIDAGVDFRVDVDVESMPLFLFKTVGNFRDTLKQSVTETLQQGLFGWRVTDCTVTLVRCGYHSPGTTVADYRKLTPLVVMSALRQAGTVVCAPVNGFRLDGPIDTLEGALRALARASAVPHTTDVVESGFVIEGDIGAAQVHELQQQVPGMSHGEGVFESSFSHYEPVRGVVPVRPRTDHNPLNRKEYLLHVVSRLNRSGR